MAALTNDHPLKTNGKIGAAYEALTGEKLPAGCFLAGTPILMADGSEKPIEAITPGDMVQSFDQAGNLRPGRVKQTFVKQSPQKLEVCGLHVTPGHVILCGDGPYAGQFVPMIVILGTDGALVTADGALVRACTGAPVGSELDRQVHVVRARPIEDGYETEEARVLRLLPMQPGDVPATWADASLLTALAGPLPRTDVTEGVARFVEWYRGYYKV